jgi:hypothetical protein
MEKAMFFKKFIKTENTCFYKKTILAIMADCNCDSFTVIFKNGSTQIISKNTFKEISGKL